MKKWILVLIVGLMICLSISPVLAVDYSGSFERTDPVTIITYTVNTDLTAAQPALIKSFRFSAIENYQQLSAIICAYDYNYWTWDYTYQGYSETVYVWAGNTQIGYGTFGFNNNSATGMLVAYFYPEYWNTAGLTGITWVNFSDNSVSPTPSAHFLAHGVGDLMPTGSHNNYASAGNWVNTVDPAFGYVGYYQLNRRFIFKNDWNMTKSTGSVRVGVTKMIGNLPYKSKAYLYQPTGQVITSDMTSSFIDFDQIVSTYPLYLAVLDSNGNWYNTTSHYKNEIGLSATPNNPTVNQLITVQAIDSVSNFTNCNFFTYMCSIGDRGVPCMFNSSAALFSKSGGRWKQFDFLTMSYITDRGIDFPSSLQMNFTSPGNTTVRGIFTMDDMSSSEASIYLDVIPDLTTSLVSFRVIDFNNGNLIQNATISVYNYQSVLWSNLTTQDGKRDYRVPTGTYLGWTATSYGYEAIYEAGMIGYDRTIDIIMNRNITRPAGNNTLWIKIRDDLGNMVTGAAVHLDDGQTTTTSNAGTAGFTVLDNHMYGISVSKKGYQGISAVFYVSGVKNSVTLIMPRLVVTTAPTLAPGVTAVTTIDSRTNTEKGDSMVKMLYDNGENIVMLCILMTIFGLLGVKFGK